MKFDALPGFAAEYDRLPGEHKAAFRAAVWLINQTYAAQRANPPIRWPPELRMKRVQGARHPVWEMTWSFHRSDGRATFEFIIIADELGILWRRVGDHAIFDQP